MKVKLASGVIFALGTIAQAAFPTALWARDFDPATDLVVFGKVRTLRSEPLDDDLFFDGQFTARLAITRVVRGRPPSRVLTIRYIAHTGRPRGYVGRYHLRRSSDGIWLACSEGDGRGYICR